jgi:predicted DNA-binding transcriptional regulator AlpA
MDQEAQKRYLTIPEVAELLGISVHTLRARVSPGSKTPFKINGKIFKPSRVNRIIRFDRIALEKAMNVN